MRAAMVAGRIGSMELKELVARQAPVHLVFPVSTLPRLAALLPAGESAAFRTDASLDVDISFDAGHEGYPRLDLRVSGKVPVVCQRCLKALAWPVKVDVQLTMVGSNTEANTLADPFDTVLLADGALETADLVEDEVLVALPLVPKHADAACAGRDVLTESSETHQPMAGLADLLRRSDRRGQE
ncbi:MAG: YceD family protein [Gammaproteobacteria bacterium]